MLNSPFGFSATPSSFMSTILGSPSAVPNLTGNNLFNLSSLLQQPGDGIGNTLQLSSLDKLLGSAPAQTPGIPATEQNPLSGLLSGMFSRSGIAPALGNIGLVDMSGTAGIFGNALGSILGRGPLGSLLGSVISGGKQAQNGLNGFLGQMLGGANPLSSILSGGAPSNLNPESPLGQILGTSFNSPASDGIFKGLLSKAKPEDPASENPKILSGLLSSPVGRADLFGGTSKTMGLISAMLRKPLSQ